MDKETFNKAIQSYLPGSEKNIAKLLEYTEFMRAKNSQRIDRNLAVMNDISVSILAKLKKVQAIRH